MNYDFPKNLQKTIVIERPFTKLAENDCAVNDFARQSSPETENWGGHIFFSNAAGTAASGTSLSTVRTYDINFLPSGGVIPSYEFQQNQIARNLEQIVNPKTKK